MPNPIRSSRRRRHLLGSAALTVGLAAAAVFAEAGPASASWYGATTGSSGANVRDCYHPVIQAPSTSCTLVRFVPAYTGIRIVCQKLGQNINGDAVWDYVVWEGGSGRPEGFAADWNINTGYANWIPGVDRCS